MALSSQISAKVARMVCSKVARPIPCKAYRQNKGAKASKVSEGTAMTTKASRPKQTCPRMRKMPFPYRVDSQPNTRLETAATPATVAPKNAMQPHVDHLAVGSEQFDGAQGFFCSESLLGIVPAIFVWVLRRHVFNKGHTYCRSYGNNGENDV